MNGEQNAQPYTANRKRGKVWPVVIALAVVAVVLGGMYAWSNRAGPLEAAHEACEDGAPGSIYWGTDGRLDVSAAFTENEMAQDGFGDRQGEAFLCIAQELDMPQRVRNDISQTTAMQGQRSESWDDIEAYWSYHPDRGLDISFERP